MLSFLDTIKTEELPEGLDEAAEEYYDEWWDDLGGIAMVRNNEHDIWYPSSVIETVFKAGAEWMAAQGFSVEATVIEMPGRYMLSADDNVVQADLGSHAKKGDKVIVQIRKK